MVRLLNQEQHDYLASIVQGRLSNEVTEMLNDRFGLQLKVSQIRAYKKNNNLKSGLVTTFKKGRVPFNKGLVGVQNLGGNGGSFKKGDKAINYKPIGSERIEDDGYTLIKISDTGKWHERWIHKQKVIYQKHFGPVPKGYNVMFADRNKQNFDPDNLILVSNKQLCVMNRLGLISDDADLTRTGLIMADIHSKTSELRSKKKKR